jgi:zinc transporter
MTDLTASAVPGEGQAAQSAFHVRVRGGSGPDLPWLPAPDDQEADGYFWVHLKRGAPDTAGYLGAAGLDPVAREALLAGETRPRWLVLESGLLVVLRGVNLNPGAEPEDMVALRLWIEPRRVITVEGRPVRAVDDLRSALADGRGPRDAGDFLAAVTRLLLNRMNPVLDELEEEGDKLEEDVLRQPKPGLRQRVGQHRRQCIQLRRHLAPMREVVAALALDADAPLAPPVRRHLHESADRLVRIVEDLDTLRDRAAVTHDELGAALGDQINTTMYRLSLIAAIFLPLSLLTSLLGINVAGIPWAGQPWAFLAVCLVLAGLGILGSLILYIRYWKRGRA